MRKRRERHVGHVQAKKLSHTVARRHKAKAADRRWVPPTVNSLRMLDNRRRREATLDQIQADREKGLENGRICRAYYREERRKARARA